MGWGRGIALQGAFPVRVASPAGSAVQQKKAVQRKPNSSAFQVDLRPKSGGWPLPRDVQAKMEAAFKTSFSDVRVHVGPEAGSIGAVAFTWGTDIHFAPGQYNPHTPHGQFLLGHELAHVVQQRAGRVANPFGGGVAVVQDHALEAEADRLGQMASAFRAAQASSSAAPSTASSCASNAINCKPAVQARYMEMAPAPIQNGWAIRIAAQGQGQAPRGCDPSERASPKEHRPSLAREISAARTSPIGSRLRPGDRSRCSSRPFTPEQASQCGRSRARRIWRAKLASEPP